MIKEGRSQEDIKGLIGQIEGIIANLSPED
jgi:hypothetical protein